MPPCRKFASSSSWSWGARRIAAASFVRPDVIPQLADGAEVVHRAAIPDEVSVSVLVPNRRGFERALDVRDRFNQVTVFLSASETHNQRNVGRSVRESLAAVKRVIADARADDLRARADDLRCEAVVSTSFGCPCEGDGPVDPVLSLARSARRRRRARDQLRRHDRHGESSPCPLVLDAARQAVEVELNAHFHNTRGQALANVLAALQAGCASFESSFGKLGGCPVVRGAIGNVATEDLVSMLHEMEIDTGIDLPGLLVASCEAQRILGRSLTSHTIVAGPDRLASGVTPPAQATRLGRLSEIGTCSVTRSPYPSSP